MSDLRSPNRRTRDRAKLFGFLFILIALVGVMVTRPLWEYMLPGATPPPAPTEIAALPATVAPTGDAGAGNGSIVPLDAQVTALPDFQAASIDRANIEMGADGERLLLYGAAEPGCPITVLIDGNALGNTLSDTDGRWTLDAPSPVAGDYVLQAVCQIDELQYPSPEIAFVIPTPAVPAIDATQPLSDTLDTADEPTDIPAEGSDVGGEAAPEPVDTAEATAEPIAEATSEPTVEATLEPTVEAPAEATPEPPTAPTFAISNNLADYVGGPLRLIGNGTPGTSVDVAVTTADGRIVDQISATVNPEGAWGVYVVIDGPGEYSVAAASAGASAEPLAISVPNDVDFGAAGSCRGRIAPLGSLDRAALTYTVNACEYFSLIANRLGVTFSQLEAANPQIANLNLVQAGDILNIPPLP